MDYDIQLKVQTYLDGELPPDEAREIANLLARDREAVALLGELRNTRQTLVGAEIGITLPETREFFWSKIQRDIQFQERSSERASPVVPATTWLRGWRRLLLPAGALCGLVLAAVITLKGSSTAPMVETAVAD